MAVAEHVTPGHSQSERETKPGKRSKLIFLQSATVANWLFPSRLRNERNEPLAMAAVRK